MTLCLTAATNLQRCNKYQEPQVQVQVQVPKLQVQVQVQVPKLHVQVQVQVRVPGFYCNYTSADVSKNCGIGSLHQHHLNFFYSV